MSLLKLEHLSAGYGKKTIISEISLSVEKGQMVGILGPNGCGKSTLMKAVCKGIPYQGEVLAEEKNIRELSEKKLAQVISYVPQRSGLAIDITVLDTVLMGFQPFLGILESPGEEMQRKAREVLVQMGMEEYIFANYMELSEGQKRLCILARSLVAEAPLLLMDEPDAALDFGVRGILLQRVLSRVREGGCGALFSLHDGNLALSFCDVIYLMKQGQLVGELHPKTEALAEMEEKLSKLYIGVRLLEYQTEDGSRKIAMVQS